MMASIDKLELFIPGSDFDVKTNSPALRCLLSSRSMDHSGESGDYLLTTLDGERVNAKKLISNDERINLTIMSLPDGTLMMFVRVNPNKWHHPFETSTSQDQYSSFRRELDQSISEKGIRCNLGSAKIARLDLAKQKQMSHPLVSYHSVFETSAKARRQHESRFNETIRIGNKQRETVLYDKQKESKLPKSYVNLIRLETRFKNHDICSKYTGLSTLLDLDRTINSDGFNHLEWVYSSYLSDEVFIPTKVVRASGLTMQERIAQIHRENPNRVRATLERELAILPAIKEAGGVSAYAELLTSCRDFDNDETRDRYYRRQRAETERILDRMISRGADVNRKYLSLLDELMSFVRDESMTPMSKTA